MLAELLILAAVTESVSELVKDFAKNGLTIGRITAVVFGQVIAWGTSLNLLEGIGITGADWLVYIGIALTGLVIGRGGNYVHDFMDRVKGVTQTNA